MDNEQEYLRGYYHGLIMYPNPEYTSEEYGIGFNDGQSDSFYLKGDKRYLEKLKEARWQIVGDLFPHG